MHVKDELKASLSLSNNANVINDQLYRKLLEHSFAELTREPTNQNIKNFYNSKPDVIKELHAALLTVIAEFARHNFSRDNVLQFLSNECNFNSSKAATFAEVYEKNKVKLQIILGNIGSHLPHIVDVKWKIDYIVKSSSLDDAEGPIFRITFSTQAYDSTECCNKIEKISFSCNSQELQDLVYKLKEATRYCQKITTEH